MTIPFIDSIRKEQMMAIFVTGDTHNEYEEFLQRVSKIPIYSGDIIIVAGDFGFIGNFEHYQHLDDLTRLPFTICFVDGNHENFDLLYKYPIEEWNGGNIHRISSNIIHLMRGQVFTIEDKKFFTMGGAYSTDKARRTEHISWWPQELPTNEEYAEARLNLEKNNYCVDYVVTHTVPRSVIYRMGYFPDHHDAELTGYLEWLADNLTFKRWFAGHFHVIEKYDNIEILYFNIERI